IRSDCGRPFCREVTDWIWTSDLVPAQLENLARNQKWRIVVFSNYKSPHDIPVVMARTERFLQDLSFDPWLFFALPKKKREGPDTLYWQLFLHLVQLTKVTP